LTENQQKALDLIRERGDKGTTVSQVASALKDEPRVAANVCRQLWDKGLVIKKYTKDVVASPTKYCRRRKQRIAVYYPMGKR
jgi:hypothetical protein